MKILTKEQIKAQHPGYHAATKSYVLPSEQYMLERVIADYQAAGRQFQLVGEIHCRDLAGAYHGHLQVWTAEPRHDRNTQMAHQYHEPAANFAGPYHNG